MDIWPPDITLTGDHVRLELLSHRHATDLSEAVSDGDLHRLWYTTVPTPDEIGNEIDRRLALRASGSMLPFAVVRPMDNKAVGMTTFMHIDAETRRVEIGSPWYRKEVQRTPLNTEAKFLLLSHAFETLDCVAVEFRTHFMNHQSRRAIERLGAKLDGILRAHMRLKNGTVRDTACYSITASEWPTVRAHLEFQMDRIR